jgi:hypothetical protein
MFLSPLAKTFEPRAMLHHSEFAIYSQGFPSLISLDEVQVIEGISDEAIAECFPPSIEEVREMEAVEIFVEMLAIAAIMEEREEVSRKFGDRKKRWSERRKEGMRVGGRPRQVTHLSQISKVNHNRLSTDLVIFDEVLLKETHFHGDSNALARSQNRGPKKEKRNTSGMRGHYKPIMQPKRCQF